MSDREVGKYAKMAKNLVSKQDKTRLAITVGSLGWTQIRANACSEEVGPKG